MNIMLRWHMFADVFVHQRVGLTISEFAFLVVLIQGLCALRDQILLWLPWLAASVLASHWAHHHLNHVNVQLLLHLYNLGNCRTSMSNCCSESQSLADKLEDFDVLDFICMLPDLLDLETLWIERLVVDGEDVTNDRFCDSGCLSENVGGAGHLRERLIALTLWRLLQLFLLFDRKRDTLFLEELRYLLSGD